MANYYATARSNYFSVTDEPRFLADMQTLPDVSVHTRESEGEQPRRFCLLADQGDGGGWPCYRDTEDGDGEDINIADVVSGHLAPGEVAIFMEAGAEKHRYVSGHAIAINAAGDICQVGLSDIYDLAAQLGENVTPAEY